MRKWRLFYLIVLTISLGVSGISYYHYHLRDKQLVEYKKLCSQSEQRLKQATRKLALNRKELEDTLNEVERLNLAVSALGKENENFKDNLELLQEQKEGLQKDLAKFLEEKTAAEQTFFAEKKRLEESLASLENKFYSLKELRKAIKIAKIRLQQEKRMERMEKHLAKVARLKRMDRLALEEGNRGYMVKTGRSTFVFRPKVTVELEPLDTLTYKQK